jgi:predicted cupin superfamily sugar epimerase
VTRDAEDSASSRSVVAARIGVHGQEEPSAAEVIAALDLEPHREGGYFRETYRAAAKVTTARGDRPVSTAILYLLSDTETSRFHRLLSDELWFYHAGALAELVLLEPTGEAAAAFLRPSEHLPEQRVIGPGSPYVLVPAGWWVAVRAITGEQTDWGAGRAPERRWTADRRSTHDIGWTLVSCVVTPGFEYEDFELADREMLLRAYPLAREAILALT